MVTTGTNCYLFAVGSYSSSTRTSEAAVVVKEVQHSPRSEVFAAVVVLVVYYVRHGSYYCNFVFVQQKKSKQPYHR